MSLCGTNKRRRTTEDRATQPMEAGGWVSQFWNKLKCITFFWSCIGVLSLFHCNALVLWWAALTRTTFLLSIIKWLPSYQLSSSEAAGRDKPQCRSRGRHLLHSSSRRIHRDASDECKSIHCIKESLIEIPKINVRKVVRIRIDILHPFSSHDTQCNRPGTKLWWQVPT